jgi:hypothetical protein
VGGGLLHVAAAGSFGENLVKRLFSSTKHGKRRHDFLPINCPVPL